ncbi:MAG: hypothetical protein ACXAE3_09195 [Candidatus Kariarchaeaceae archaeon]|jgi:hypothetical protein
MTRNTQCLLTILGEHPGGLTTAQILDETINYPELCKSCSSGSVIISTAKELMEEGKVSRKVEKGGFVWSLQ